MRIPRVIPTLLLSDEAFVKTTRYSEPRYVGDPTNVINLFNRFEVDEIVLLDIEATAANREPPYELIHALAAECWVPLTYGGGIRSLEQARRVLGIGAEKVVLGTAAADSPPLIGEISETFGSQAVVVSVDARGAQSGHECFVTNATRSLGIDPVEYARRAEDRGAGEILLNAVDRDGTMEGFDLELVRDVASAVRIPVIASGGARDRSGLRDPIDLAGASAVAAGSLFVYRGAARGVLINFPPREQLEEIFAS